MTAMISKFDPSEQDHVESKNNNFRELSVSNNFKVYFDFQQYILLGSQRSKLQKDTYEIFENQSISMGEDSLSIYLIN